jgi:hypothetical protein
MRNYIWQARSSGCKRKVDQVGIKFHELDLHRHFSLGRAAILESLVFKWEAPGGHSLGIQRAKHMLGHACVLVGSIDKGSPSSL